MYSEIWYYQCHLETKCSLWLQTHEMLNLRRALDRDNLTNERECWCTVPTKKAVFLENIYYVVGFRQST